MAGPTAPPPAIDGFAHERLLGSGGFADVYLYRDIDLDRPVAIKVLRNTIDDAETQESFVAESKLMAKVSGHPYIVQIYRNGVAADGRPYLVMQYYPGESYGQRIRGKTLTVAETLEVGVQVSSALETAHRAGIVHRDVKPANLLTDRFGKPGLTDFGISGALTDGSLGFSPPYAPPEVVMDENGGDERSDVFSLAATLYALLAGRSPFENAVGENTRSAVTARVLNDQPYPIGRDDVLPMLERLLAQALAKDPASRPSSALAFGRSLQAVQQNLHYAATPLDLESDRPDIAPQPIDPTDEDRTRFGGVKVVDPEQVPAPQPLSTPTDSAPASTGSSVISGLPDTFGSSAPSPREFDAADAILPEPAEEGTVVRGVSSVPESAPPDIEPKRPIPVWQIVTGVVALFAVVVGTVVVLASGSTSESVNTDQISPGVSGGLVIVEQPNTPEDVTITSVGEIVKIAWSVDDAVPDDLYQVTHRIDEGESILTTVEEPNLEIEGVKPGSRVCASVIAIRSGRFSAPSPLECNDV